jgi:TetR/AcrR family transcriptional regulator, regulator of cefoperazone and chloramphenicol sensitivity
MKPQDRETRQRVLDAAVRLFAERGFKKVTVREICRAARANVAAVNYHFGDKLGLYREVLQEAIAVMRRTNEAAEQAGGNGSPEEKLRAHIDVYLHRLCSHGGDFWLHRLISREVADPTPALDLIVEQAIRPRVTYLRELVSRLLACKPTDERVTLCVASIQAQCIMALPNPIGSRLRLHVSMGASDIDRLAEHVAEFSMAGIRQIGRASPRPRR